MTNAASIAIVNTGIMSMIASYTKIQSTAIKCFKDKELGCLSRIKRAHLGPCSLYSA